MIFLLNRDSLELIDNYIKLHDPTDYCPFMIMDKCIIHAYKPSACQMFMPFTHAHKLACYYLADREMQARKDLDMEYLLNSNCYDVHGFMLKTQHDVAGFLGRSFFKNIAEGIVWWRAHYASLPEMVRDDLESIVAGDAPGLERIRAFSFEKALREGHRAYLQRLGDCTELSSPRAVAVN